jgi:formylmethanofuran dehydrogenase subunit A
VSRLLLARGRIVDPANRRRGEVGDLHIQDGRIVDPPAPGTPIDRTYDLAGLVVMPGGIDIHSHIAGGKVNLARALMPHDHRAHPMPRDGGRRSGGGRVTPSTFATGYRYAELGYTAAFEPAMVAANARHAHAELADTPMIDKGCYVMLGNDDLLLRLLAEDASPAAIADYVAWMVTASQALAVKVVNPGGISAFKFNGRRLGLDEPGPYYEVTPRRILTALARAVHELGLAHPLHVHANQLGVPGNLATTLATIAAAEGVPLHLTHVQFHSYGQEGDRKFSSGAAEIAEAVNGNPNISIDVGQIMFGRTVTASGDTMMQYRNRLHADPKKWLCMDIECDGGCGLVPFRYRDQSFVNALQWAIGLELFLLVEDPWRVFLTTDHPNGAPFTTYPHLIRLLMDRGFRAEKLAAIHPAATKASRLAGLDREYDLHDIAVITRAGPARALGLSDRGHLGAGAVADIAVYEEQDDKEAMFSRAAYVFKDGRLVVRDGTLVETVAGATHVARPEHDPAIERRIEDHFARFLTVRAGNFRLSDGEIADAGGALVAHPCRRAGS